MIPGKHAAALQIILPRLAETDITWVLTGSTSFALQGLPLTPNDIDLQTDQAGACEIERCFQEFVTHPVQFSSTGTVRSHFGELSIHGVKVEIIGDIEKLLPDGTWSPPPDLRQHTCWVEWGTFQIPVLSLEYEADAYQKLGRVDRAAQLREWAKTQPETGA